MGRAGSDRVPRQPPSGLSVRLVPEAPHDDGQLSSLHRLKQNFENTVLTVLCLIILGMNEIMLSKENLMQGLIDTMVK